MDDSENSGTPKSSILIGFSIINHPFWGATILGNPIYYRLILTTTLQLRKDLFAAGAILIKPRTSIEERQDMTKQINNIPKTHFWSGDIHGILAAYKDR